MQQGYNMVTQRAPDGANNEETLNAADRGDQGGDQGGGGRRFADSCAQTGPPSFRMVRFKQGPVLPEVTEPRCV